MTTDFSFIADYKIDLNPELSPSGEDVYYFKHNDPSPRSGLSGLLVRFERVNRSAWIGGFARGYESSEVITGFFSAPNPIIGCVISAGAGYWTDVNTAKASDVAVFPIRQVLPVPVAKLLLFCDYNKLAAYGGEGKRWQTSPLCSDKLEITAATASIVKCQGWDAARGEFVTFNIDIKTGLFIQV